MTQHELVVSDLTAEVAGRTILNGVDLVVRSGEVHAIMGPNGSGKSTLSYVLTGRPGYTVTGGSITLDGAELVGMSPHERAEAGLFLGMQYPTEVPGVSMEDLLSASTVAAATPDPAASIRAEAARVGLDPSLIGRSLNVDFSGGEKKRNETVQLALLRPKFAILDEIDSGLDVDALAQVSQRVEEATTEWGLGVIAVTHYNRLLEKLHADVVHIFAKGRILESGGPELATQLEVSGYAGRVEAATDIFAEPDAIVDPFADPFA